MPVFGRDDEGLDHFRADVVAIEEVQLVQPKVITVGVGIAVGVGDGVGVSVAVFAARVVGQKPPTCEIEDLLSGPPAPVWPAVPSITLLPLPVLLPPPLACTDEVIL